MRAILASSRGTLLELDIMSTSGMLLAGANLVDVDFSLKDDKVLSIGARKRACLSLPPPSFSRCHPKRR